MESNKIYQKHMEKLNALSTRVSPSDHMVELRQKNHSLTRTRQFEINEKEKYVKKRNIHLLGKFIEISKGKQLAVAQAKYD